MFKMCRKQEATAIRLKIEGKGSVNVHYVTKNGRMAGGYPDVLKAGE